MSKNLSRTLLVAFSIGFTIALGDNLDDFLSLLGAVSCTPVAFIFPAVFHLKAVASTKLAKTLDVVIIFIGICIFIGCSILDVEEWVKKA